MSTPNVCCTAAAAQPSQVQGAARPRRASAWPLITLAFGFVMAMLDVTVVNVALDSLRTDLSLTLAGQVWVVDSYTLLFASLLLAGGALANRYGARGVYMAGLGLFVAASLLCASAASGAALIGARLLQGTAAALFIPASMGLLTRAYPDERERARAMGLWSALISLSASSGPLVGGTLITWLGWRAIFWLNVPIGLVGIWLAPRHLAATPRQPQVLNLWAHACAATALGALAYALIQGPSVGWGMPPVLLAETVCVLAALGFYRHQRVAASPVVPRALLQHAWFRRINMIGLQINFAVYGTLFLMSLYYPQARHASALATGLNLLPLMLMFTLGNLLAARLLPRHGASPLLRGGLGLAAVATGLASAFALVHLARPAWALDVLIASANLGAGIAIPAMTSSVMAFATKEHVNTAAAVLNANRQIGALVGIAAVAVVMHGWPDWSLRLWISLGLLALSFAMAAALCWRQR